MDVIGSDPPGPPRGRWGSRLARLRGRMPARRVPRAVVAGVVVLAGVAVVLGLRAGAGPVVPAVPAVPEPTPVAALPTGPFDRLPGRTPIPAPTASGISAFGELPATGEPSKASAVRAAQLVLGRYCLRPERYTVSVAEQDGWNSVGVVAAGLDRGGDGGLIDLVLVWTGTSYSWAGSVDQLRVC